MFGPACCKVQLAAEMIPCNELVETIHQVWSQLIPGIPARFNQGSTSSLGTTSDVRERPHSSAYARSPGHQANPVGFRPAELGQNRFCLRLKLRSGQQMCSRQMHWTLSFPPEHQGCSICFLRAPISTCLHVACRLHSCFSARSLLADAVQPRLGMSLVAELMHIVPGAD